jgi:hypothetical protein
LVALAGFNELQTSAVERDDERMDVDVSPSVGDGEAEAATQPIEGDVMACVTTVSQPLD